MIRVSTVRCRSNSSSPKQLLGATVNAIRLGTIGNEEPFHAGDQVERTMEIKRLRVADQENDFRRSITRHIMTTDVLKPVVNTPRVEILTRLLKNRMRGALRRLERIVKGRQLRALLSRLHQSQSTQGGRHRCRSVLHSHRL
jgi:hypothetical protein